MKIKRKKKKYIYNRISFWLGILIIGAAVGIIVQFTKAWVEPPSAATPPGGDIAAPINTGATTQTKVGGDICVDTNSDGANDACLSSGGNAPVGTIVMWSGNLSTIPAGWALCNGRNGTPDLRSRFVYGVGSGQNPGGTGSISYWDGHQSGPGYVQDLRYVSPGEYYQVAFIIKEGSGWVNTDLTGGNHNQSDCTSAGGTVVWDGSAAFCQFSGGSCSAGWTQYNNWSTTSVKTCNGVFDTSHSCNSVAGDRTTCTTPNHGWGNVAPSSESCTVDNNQWVSGSSCGYFCYYRSYYDDYCGCNMLHYYDIWNCSACSSLSGTTTCVDWTGANNLWAVQGIADCFADCGCQVPYAYCSHTSSSCFSTINQVGCY